MAELAPLAITMGEPAGVGPDIVLQIYAKRVELGATPFAVYGPVGFYQKRAERLGLKFKIKSVLSEYVKEAFAEVLPVISLDGQVADNPGLPVPGTAQLVIESIERAVADIKAGAMRALVTAPIQKSVLYGAGFTHPGHTEFLAELCRKGDKTPMPVMMLVAGDLRVVPVTVHVPLHEVPWRLTTNLIVSTCRTLHAALKGPFAIKEPRIGMTGLNPHAGEGGSIGEQEAQVIIPAIAALKAEGIAIEGPLPADTAFIPERRKRFDAVVAMYHDQALIPIKALAFEEVVNVTLGLPIVRTSPGHGTGLDLAGTGKASIRSFANAVRLADDLTRY